MPPPSEAMSRDELKRRASSGIFIVGSFGFLNLVVGFGGNVVLARLLLPHDFGIVALGATLSLFAWTLCDGGLGAGLIRRPEPPSRPELRAVVAIQLAVMTTIAGAAAAVALAFGPEGRIVAVMMLAIPLTAFELPGRLVLQRALLYRRLAAVDGAGIVLFYAWAIGTVVAGFGVWGLATATVVRPLAGVLMLPKLSGLGFVLPSTAAIRDLMPVMRFGIKFQSVPITVVIRDHLLILCTGVVAGVATAGLWSFARRLLEAPMLVFQGIWRVSFPAMAHLLAARENPAPVMHRCVALSSIAAGFVLATFAAASPELVPAVFGEPWRAAAAVIPPSCLALLILGPISVASVGFLHAAGDPMTVLRASVVFSLAWIAVAMVLLPFVGVAALGIGWVVGGVLEAHVHARGVARHVGARLIRPLLVPLGIGLAAGAAGVAVTVAADERFISAVFGGLVAAGVHVAGLAIFRRALLVETVSAVLHTVISTVRPPGAQVPSAAEPATAGS